MNGINDRKEEKESIKYLNEKLFKAKKENETKQQIFKKFNKKTKNIKKIKLKFSRP